MNQGTRLLICVFCGFGAAMIAYGHELMSWGVGLLLAGLIAWRTEKNR